MLRGFIAGGLWGLVIGTAVLALTSQIADWRDLTPAVAEDGKGGHLPPPTALPEPEPQVLARLEPARRPAPAVVATGREPVPDAASNGGRAPAEPVIAGAPPEGIALGDVVPDPAPPQATAIDEPALEAASPAGARVSQASAADALPKLADAPTEPAGASTIERPSPVAEPGDSRHLATLAGQVPADPGLPPALARASADAALRPQAPPARIAGAPAPESSDAPRDDTAPTTAPTETALFAGEVAKPARPGDPAAPDPAARLAAGPPRSGRITVVDTAPEPGALDTPAAGTATPRAEAAPAALPPAPEVMAGAVRPDIAPDMPPAAPVQPALSPPTATVVASAVPDEMPEKPARLRPGPAPRSALPDIGTAAAEAPPRPAMPAPARSARTTGIAATAPAKDAVPALAAPLPQIAAADPAKDLAPAPAAHLPQIAAPDPVGAEGQVRAAVLPSPALPGAPQRIRVGGASMPGQRVGPLPRIGVVTQGEAPGPAGKGTDPDGALRRNAAAFTPPEGADLMAVVLVHDGAGAGATAAALPEGVTVAISARLPGAAEIARAYSEAGHEVVLIADLPPRATPQDAEVALAAGLAALPGAVALMDGAPGGVAAGRDTAPTLVSTAARDGYGVVTFSRGFSAVEQLARNAGVPIAPVFRQIDGTGTLSQGAFRARQTGSAVLLGRVTDAAVAAIRAWREGSDASVVIAPLSAVLTGG